MNNTYPDKKSTIPSSASKSSNSWIYWVLGCCGIIILISIIIVIGLGYGAFNIAKNVPKPDLNNQLEDKLNSELDKIDKQLKDLEDKTTKEKTTNKPTDEVQDKEAILQVGSIEGSLSYPSEVIPDLTVCAEEVGNTTNQYCTSDLISNPKYTAGRGYKLDVAPGKYYVFSYFITPDYKAYYTEFVPCGLDISCPSHDKIVVTVNDGDTITNIDPVDWYMP